MVTITVTNIITAITVTNIASKLYKLLIGSLCLFLAFFIIYVQASKALVQNKQWQTAIAFPIREGTAAANLSSDLLAKQDDKASLYAKLALSKSLTHVPAIRTLGIDRFNNGDEDSGRLLIELAGMLSWRDSPTHSWLMERSLLDQDYKKGLQHADALLRRQKAEKEIFAIFTLAAQSPELAELIIQQLAAEPPWRRRFFPFASNLTQKQYRGFENIADGLAATKTPLSKEEALHYFTNLQTNTQIARASRFWTKLFPNENNILKANEKLILAWPEDIWQDRARPLDWRFKESRDIEVTVIEHVAKDMPKLNIVLNRRAFGEIATRQLILENGDITLTLSDTLLSDNDAEEIRWSLICLDNAGKREETEFLRDPKLAAWQVRLDGSCNIYQLNLSVAPSGLSNSAELNLGSVILTHTI